jgi:amino acid transporter
MPVGLLIFQAIIVTFLSLIFILMPNVNSAYWILTVLIAELYLVMYFLLFASLIKLRYKRPNVERPYKIPGGKAGAWIVVGLGLISSLFAFIIGFFPPSQITTGNEGFYVSFLIIGVIVFCLGPTIILCFQKPHWKHPLEHEKNR